MRTIKRLRGILWKFRLLRYIKRHQCRLCGEFAKDGVDIGCMSRVWAHRSCANAVLDQSRRQFEQDFGGITFPRDCEP